MPGSISCYARCIAGIRQAWHLHLDAVSASCPRCEWHFYGILRGFRLEEPVPVDARDAEPGSCRGCRWQCGGIFRGLCHEQQVPGDERRCQGVLRVYCGHSATCAGGGGGLRVPQLQFFENLVVFPVAVQVSQTTLSLGSSWTRC